MNIPQQIKQRLSQSSDIVFIVFVGCMAFSTYLCMYAFRKPFTVGTYTDIDWSYALDMKTCLLISQVVGYALSKFIGIKVISEMTPERRAKTLILLIVFAELALLLLPILPAPFNLVSLFLNGLPLGMVWGLVFSFLEGRRVTEAVGAILCSCFIFGSGVVKSVGKVLLLDYGVPELWMPFITGLIFLPFLVISVYGLTLIPNPSSKDIEHRKQRVPMDSSQRKAFFLRYWPGLLLLIIVYTMLSALRDFTDNFAAEIWIALGYGDTPSIFTTTSIPISLIVLAVMFSLMVIRDNHKALQTNHYIVTLGCLIILGSTFCYQLNMLGGAFWFVLMNMGLYMAYIPFNCILFERLVATSSSLANAGFLIYLADSFGYLASVNVLLYKSFLSPNLPWLEFTLQLSIIFSAACALMTFGASIYFKKSKNNNT